MHRAIPATALAAVLALGAAACGSDSDESSAPAAAASAAASPSASGSAADFAQVLQASQAATMAAGTARVELTAGVGMAGQAQDVSATGAFDFAAEKGQLTVKTGIGGQSVSVKTVVAKDVIYVQNPASPGQWIKQEVPQGIGGLASGNPAAALGTLSAATDDVQLVGKEAVRGGDQADHYTGTIDASELAKDLPQAQQDQLSALGQDWPFEAWIDDEGKLRKLTLSAGGAGTAGGASSAPKPAPTDDTAGMSLTVTVELYDFGTPVTVQTPAPGSVREAPGLGSGLGGDSAEPAPAATAGA
ncbi:LppX_LprAFG lipoprotein [Motilibacter deserti]|uniref:LppX_LprAFG lipoprotein n=1 Tax=Motilibacter deserti TaxID=2714956 RepID=A0ABX0GV80_9ACTN|nr:LppX_LprAFG lipoprotein [Motilibacter deserti]NHC14831.1 LppX_LprAFG lipoprotein [Motilibacter deserti]